MAAPKKPQAEKPMSPPREHGLPLEGESMRILQQAVAAAEQAVTGAERITARASQLESALNAVAKTHQALIETRERAVAAAQEQATRAIATAEASLSRIGQPAVPPPAAPTPSSQESATAARSASPEPFAAIAQEQADQAMATAELAISNIVKSNDAAIESFGRTALGDLSKAAQHAVTAEEQAVEAAQRQVKEALAATEGLVISTNGIASQQGS